MLFKSSIFLRSISIFLIELKTSDVGEVYFPEVYFPLMNKRIQARVSERCGIGFKVKITVLNVVIILRYSP